MNILKIIAKKRDNEELSKNEIEYFVNSYVSGEVEDYQASALLMAIYLNGMNDDEIYNLTMAMVNSSTSLDFSGVFKNSYVVDKHSTGGIGDKVTIIAIPIAAALGVKCFKMSGNALGFTGGTADKLSSIDGFVAEQEIVDALRVLNKTGACMITQTQDLAIADKKLYALRSITSTVESIPLIASSIMSKKIASGVDKIVLEVTFGSGAFMKDEEKAKKLAKTMVEIGKRAKKETVTILTNMEGPLGNKVGNSLEIEEAMEFLLSDRVTLESELFKDLTDIVFETVAYMMKLSDLGDSIRENKVKIMEAILNRSAYNKFIEIIKAQGGHTTNIYMENIGLDIDIPIFSNKAQYMKTIKADKNGYVRYVDAYNIGYSLVSLGAGKLKNEDVSDLSVGFNFKKKTGDKVNKGDTILEVYFNDKDKIEEAVSYLSDSIKIENYIPIVKPSVVGIIGEKDEK